VSVCVCVCGSARRRTSKLARGRCARVLCTSTVTVVGGRGGGGGGPRRRPSRGHAYNILLLLLCACPARCTTGGARTVGMRPRFPRAPRHTPPPPPQHTSRRRRPGTAVYIKPAVPLGHAVIRTIRTEPSTRARPSFVFYCLHNIIFIF